MLPVPAQHQGTASEFTVVSMLRRAATDKGGVILCWTPFLILFWRSKKVKEARGMRQELHSNNLLSEDILYPP